MTGGYDDGPDSYLAPLPPRYTGIWSASFALWERGYSVTLMPDRFFYGMTLHYSRVPSDGKSRSYGIRSDSTHGILSGLQAVYRFALSRHADWPRLT